jgi:hypothetical protein
MSLLYYNATVCLHQMLCIVYVDPARLCERKSQLAPMVAHWQQLNEDEAALVPRKNQHLQQAIRWLVWALRHAQLEVRIV